eukprot:scaffold72515_cov52-Attheya_sp.AAC.2
MGVCWDPVDDIWSSYRGDIERSMYAYRYVSSSSRRLLTKREAAKLMLGAKSCCSKIPMTRLRKPPARGSEIGASIDDMVGSLERG